MKQYVKYLKYVLEHKKNVFIECWKERMYLHAFTHDLSKFSIKEFKAYAEWFHGGYGIVLGKCPVEEHLHYSKYIIVKDRFNKAWQHHKDKNKHHWNYWHERNLPMPYKYIKQMICDWRAMSKKFGDTAQEFYLNNYNKIQMNNNSRMMLEFELGLNDSMINNYGHTLKQFYEMDKEVYFGDRYFGWIIDKYGVDIDKCLCDKRVE